ncbi:hypothetical protein [Burkholderia multivorans]|uniref:hypothetical protein n=1 Tax=Burkholderia multivorans TaxID=87883 RepID=UPI0015E29CCE|nr:hypothetical protein [Burkholderia multivorans]MDN8050537.1 hypothetical protein [Burkholderia multivorans]
MKDFTGKGADSFYWFQDGLVRETDAASIVGFEGIVVCHDFWMIRDALFDKTKSLPGAIVAYSGERDHAFRRIVIMDSE